MKTDNAVYDNIFSLKGKRAQKVHLSLNYYSNNNKWSIKTHEIRQCENAHLCFDMYSLLRVHVDTKEAVSPENQLQHQSLESPDDCCSLQVFVYCCNLAGAVGLVRRTRRYCCDFLYSHCSGILTFLRISA